jgi:cbb3-type cytochrome oxidase maturation protein
LIRQARVDILYLLIPFSALLVLAILAIFAWALRGGQFDDLEREGERILDGPLDGDQPPPMPAPEQSPRLRGSIQQRRGGEQ